ncbi:hypothetical protein RSOLAG22IIIB_01802 [Rhizoctonia solani]|uniref:DUF7330 domain-containing protein n=1 Tax=Rhizoctonia solani TaxID=456999 RepID=A0A0K6G9W3_9AGAM|nr:hypothetical protein RSOLAG22IIIB_01802 [Rhizoctonia solani]
MTTRNASSRKTDNQPPRPLVIVQTGNTPLIGDWSIDTRFTRGTHSRSRSNSHNRSGSGYSPRDHRDTNVGPTDVQLRTEHGEIRAAFSVIGREVVGQGGDRANLDVQSMHGNIQVRISRDAGRRFRLTASSDTGCVVIVLPPDFVGTITHGERTSFSARAFRLVRLGATVATMPTNWPNRPRSRLGSVSSSKGKPNSGAVDNSRRSGSETVTTRGMRHLSVERDGTLRTSDAVEVRAGRNVRIIVSGEPLWHANPLVARVMGMFMKH